MARPGFEADRDRIMLYDRASGEIEELSKDLDQTAHHLNWKSDSTSIYFDGETRGTNHLYRIDLNTRQVTQVSQGRFDFRLARYRQ